MDTHIHHYHTESHLKKLQYWELLHSLNINFKTSLCILFVKYKNYTSSNPT